MCATLKADFPAKANDPNLCVFRHIEQSTDFIPAVVGKTGGLIAASCPNGTKGFADNYQPLDQEFGVHLFTNWRWNGSCGVPQLTSEQCVRDFQNFGIVLENPVCTSYTTSVPSRAALREYWEQ